MRCGEEAASHTTPTHHCSRRRQFPQQLEARCRSRRSVRVLPTRRTRRRQKQLPSRCLPGVHQRRPRRTARTPVRKRAPWPAPLRLPVRRTAPTCGDGVPDQLRREAAARCRLRSHTPSDEVRDQASPVPARRCGNPGCKKRGRTLLWTTARRADRWQQNTSAPHARKVARSSTGRRNGPRHRTGRQGGTVRKQTRRTCAPCPGLQGLHLRSSDGKIPHPARISRAAQTQGMVVDGNRQLRPVPSKRVSSSPRSRCAADLACASMTACTNNERRGRKRDAGKPGTPGRR